MGENEPGEDFVCAAAGSVRRQAALVVVLCALAAGLPVPGFARADGDDGGPEYSCLLWARYLPMPKMSAAAPRYETVPAERVPGVELSLPPGDGWGESDAGSFGQVIQKKESDEGQEGSVVVEAFQAKSFAVLRAMSEEFRQMARTDTPFVVTGPRRAVEVLDDTEGSDALGRFWMVRTRTTWQDGDVLCRVEEAVNRNVLFERGGLSYLVDVRGYTSWYREVSGDGPGPDPAVGDEVAERVSDAVRAAAAG